MKSTTQIPISISILNFARPFPSLRREGKDGMQGYVLLDTLKADYNENLKWNLAQTVPEGPGNGSVPDPIGSPAERRKGGPQEEFIDVDPNFTKERSEEEKEELLERARKENKKVD